MALTPGRDVKGLLLGEAALPEERERMLEALERNPHVDKVVELRTMALAPNALLVAVRLDHRPDLPERGTAARALRARLAAELG